LLAVTCERFARLRLDVLGQAERAGQRVELAQLVLVLEAQLLLLVGALDLGDEGPPLPKLQLQAQPLVRRAQILALVLVLCDALHRHFALLARRLALGVQLRRLGIIAVPPLAPRTARRTPVERRAIGPARISTRASPTDTTTLGAALSVAERLRTKRASLTFGSRAATPDHDASARSTTTASSWQSTRACR
jgi:hypothetical protein